MEERRSSAPEDEALGGPPEAGVRLLDLDGEGLEGNTPPASAAVADTTVADTTVATARGDEPPSARTKPEPPTNPPLVERSETERSVADADPLPEPPNPERSEATAGKISGGDQSSPQPPARVGLRPDPLDEMPALRPSPITTPQSSSQRTGHPVRDRLLARAASASQPPAKEPAVPGTPPTLSALNGLEEELEQMAAPRGKMLSEPFRVAGAVLSPTATLVGVTVVGLAALVSMFVLLVQFAPRHDSGQSASQPVVDGEPGARLENVVPPSSALPPVSKPVREKIQGPWRISAAATGQRLIRGTIGSNPFLRAIQEAGLDKSQAYRVFGALKEHKNLDRCRPKDEFIALLDRTDSRVVAFEYVVSKEEVYQARENGEGKLVGKQLDMQVEKHQVQGSLVVLGSFAQAATAAGLQPSIGTVVNRALEGHTSVSQFKPGDRLRIVAQEVTVLGEFQRYAGIEALEYVPVDGSPIRIYYHPAKKRYYDAKGRAPGEGGWRRPVRNAPITSKYNPQRLHPILKKRMPHNGTDFGAPTGTPVYAASYGKVTKLGNYGANGNFIAIEHPNGYETGYSHLSRFEQGLKVGDQVKRAQAIGYVGSTGRSTGPHLHFSAKKNGVFIDPETLNLDALTVLPSNERAAFSAIREKYDALLESVALAPAITPPPSETIPSEPVNAAIAAHQVEEEGVAEAEPVANQGVESAAAVSPASAQLNPVPPSQPNTLVASPTPQALAPKGAFYLTDKELLQAQPSVDYGEVEE